MHRISAIFIFSTVILLQGAEPVADSTWFKAFARQKSVFLRDKPEVLFVGDSLTEFWTSTGKANWELDFHDLNPGNYGIAADRVGNIEYRILVLNEALKSGAEKEKYHFLDVHDDFLDAKSRRWRKELTLDGTHLSARGYDILARKVRPALVKIF